MSDDRCPHFCDCDRCLNGETNLDGSARAEEPPTIAAGPSYPRPSAPEERGTA